MPQAGPDCSTPRRAMLALATLLPGGAALAATPPGAAPDARLLDLCARFDAISAREHGLVEGCTGPEDEERVWGAYDVFHAEHRALLDLIAAEPATTPSGILALGRSLARWQGEAMDDYIERMEQSPGWDDRLVGAILRGLVRVQG